MLIPKIYLISGDVQMASAIECSDVQNPKQVTHLANGQRNSHSKWMIKKLTETYINSGNEIIRDGDVSSYKDIFSHLR